MVPKEMFIPELLLMDATENPRFKEFMTIVDKYRKMGVRTNAETPEDATIARNYGAEGIGLFPYRTYVLR
jgi:pyruvate,orthophosphate dikinase